MTVGVDEIKKKFQNKKRFYFLVSFIIAVFVLFTARLVDWQIINHDYYKIRANSSNMYFVKTDPVRGEILDSSGVGLAVNDTGYKIVVEAGNILEKQEVGCQTGTSCTTGWCCKFA